MSYQRLVIQGRVIVALFLSYLLSNASLQVIGTFMPALADEFNVGPAALGWICSSGWAIMCLIGPVTGMISNKVEPRWVVMVGGFTQAVGLMVAYLATSLVTIVIGFGFLNGIGASLVYVSAPMTIAAYFNSFYTTAIGVVFAGIGVGIFIFPPLIETLMAVYGWRAAALLHGAILLNIVALGALLPVVKSKIHTSTKLSHKDSQYRQIIPNKEQLALSKEAECVVASDERTEPKIKWYLTYVQLFTTSPSMALLYIVAFLQNFGNSATITHLYNQIIMNGYSHRQGAWALSLLGVGSLLGRLLNGVPVDAGIMLPSTLYEISLFAAALVTFINPLANNLVGFIISATGAGFLIGIIMPLLYTIMKRKVGTSLLAPAVGLELLCDGLGITCGGYTAGLIEQLSGDYRLSFYTIGAAFLLASCVFLPICLAERKAYTRLAELDSKEKQMFKETRV